MAWQTVATIALDAYGNVLLQYNDSSSGNTRQCQVIFQLTPTSSVSVIFQNFTVGGTNYGSKNVSGNMTLWSGNLPPGNCTVSWTCAWYTGAKTYSGTGTIPGSSTPAPSTSPPTGLSIRLNNVYTNGARFSVSLSSYGNPSNASGRWISAEITTGTTYGGSPRLVERCYNSSSASITVNNSSGKYDGSLTIQPNTTYHYGAYANNTQSEVSVMAGTLTTLCATPSVSFGSQSYTSSTTVQAKINYSASRSDGNALTRTLYWRYSTNGGSSYGGWTSLGSSSSGTITLDLATGKSVSVQVRANTKAGDSGYGSCSFTTLATHTPPKFSNFTYKDSNATTVALTGDDQTMIQGQSVPSVTVPVADKATWDTSIAVTSYTVSFCSASKSMAYSASEDVTTTLPAPDESGTRTLRVAAVDSMTGSTAVTKDVTIYPWVAPIVNATFERSLGEETGTECVLRINGDYSPLEIGGTAKNTIAVSYRLKPSGEEWDGTNTKTGTREVKLSGNSWSTDDYILSLDDGQWDAEVTVTDIFTSVKVDLKLTSGIPRFFIGKDGRVGVGKKPDTNMGDNKGQLEVDGDVYAKNIYSNQNPVLTKASKTELLNLIYPVGSIYMSMNDTSPQTFLGGTWERIAEGRTLVGVASGDSDFGSANKTGGAKTVTLTEAQIPSHTHTGTTSDVGDHTHGVLHLGSLSGSNLGWTGSSGTQSTQKTLPAGAHHHTFTTAATGSGQAHNNLPPYLTCYIWRRTA